MPFSGLAGDGHVHPAQTGRRVLYGHPFETVNAEDEKQAVEALYAGRWGPEEVEQYLNTRGVDYIFYGPREEGLGKRSVWQGYPVVYENEDVAILSVGNQP